MKPALQGLAVLAATVALTIAAMAPASAANFSFGFGIGPGMYFGDDDEDYVPGNGAGGLCFTDYMLRQELSRQGYGDIRLGSSEGREQDVDATRGGQRFKLEVNKCTGVVLSRRRAR
jgi:hypothetical protein